MIIDHHKHQDIYTYNLSVPKKFTLDVPNQSPPLTEDKKMTALKSEVDIYLNPFLR